MKRKGCATHVVAAILLFFFASSASALQKSVPSYQHHLKKLQKYAGKVGVQIVAIPLGRTVWQYNSKQPLVPASLVKVLTSYTALKQLGPFHHFETSVWALRKPKKGILRGDIWIRSNGDPYLTSERAWSLAVKLREAGILDIRGGIFIDNSYFKPESEQICLDGKCGSPYNPLISATALDFNTITLRVLPGVRVGAPAKIESFPPNDYARIVNQTTTVARLRKAKLRIVSLGVTPARKEKFKISGKIPLKAGRNYEYRFNIKDPVGFAGYGFRALFRQAGIKIEKKRVGRQTVPPGAIKLLVSKSPPLCDTLFGLNRYSNNFMAEMLLRDLGAVVLNPPGTVPKGVSAIRKVLAREGIPEHEVILDSGSGLSRHCRVSPRAFSRVLTSAYNDFSIAPEFLSSLAVNGKEGTLRKRMRRSSVIVRGKTGTLRNVCGFAGYVAVPGGKIYAATIILNEVKKPWEAKKAIYDFLENLPSLASSS